MKKLTFLAAAFAAGLTSFAANSAPHPSKSLRAEAFDGASAAKKQEKIAAKDVKQEKTTAAKEKSQPKSDKAKAEIVKTPIFSGNDSATKSNPVAEEGRPKGTRVAKKSAPKNEQVAKKAAPENKQVAEMANSKNEQVPEQAAPRKKRVAEKAAPRREKIASKKARKASGVAQSNKKQDKNDQLAAKLEGITDDKAAKAVKIAMAARTSDTFADVAASKQAADRQVEVKEPLALDLLETASLGGKGATTMKGGNGKYGGIIALYASSYGVPVALAHAVIQVESNYRPDAKGSAGEIGLMQIKPATARMMGYSGSNQGLFNPETNIKFGMKYLAKAHRLGGQTTCGTILRYNAGHGATRMNPVSSAYCSKVKRFLGV